MHRTANNDSVKLLAARAIGLCIAAAALATGCVAPPPKFTLSPEQQLLMTYEESMRVERPAEAREAATRLFATEREPWVQVLIAQSYAVESDLDSAFRELSAAIDTIATDPIRAGPMAIDLAESLDSRDDEWKLLRADSRFPTILARAKAAAWKPGPLSFDGAPSVSPPRTPLPQVDAEPLRTIREEFRLASVVDGASDDLDRVRRICNWAHGRTSHEGWGIDAPPDALGLLRAAETGA